MGGFCKIAEGDTHDKMKHNHRDEIKVKQCYVNLKFLNQREINKHIYNTKQLKKIANDGYIKDNNNNTVHLYSMPIRSFRRLQ